MSRDVLLKEITKFREMEQAAREAHNKMMSPGQSNPDHQRQIVELKTRNSNLLSHLNSVAINDKTDFKEAEQTLKKSQLQIMQKIREKANKADDLQEIGPGKDYFDSEEMKPI